MKFRLPFSGPRARDGKIHLELDRKDADVALAGLITISRHLEGKRLGDVYRELAGEMRAVHPEWNRAQRRAYIQSFDRKGRR